MSFENYEYDIVTVCNMAGIAVDPNKNSQYIDCPLCGGKKKMHIDLTGNGFICHHCGEKGGVLKLYMLLFNCPDTKTAHQELMKAVSGDETARKKVEYRKANPPKPEVTVADIGSRDKAYNALLSNLSLTTVHKINLLERGLSDADIERNGYKTVPALGCRSICLQMKEAGIQMKDIPGFYSKDGKDFLVKMSPGFFVPVRNLSGKISCMQIRHDEVKDGKKYSYLSSSWIDGGVGVSGTDRIHHTGFNGKIPKKIGITEGALKADVASSLLGIPFIGIIGVRNSSHLGEALSVLKREGVNEVLECFDTDYLTNPFVKEGVDKAHEVIKSMGFDNVRRITWDASFKGIDDYALHLKKIGKI